MRHSNAAPNRAPGDEVRLSPLGNDSWTATVALPEQGWWEYAILAWVDRFGSWRDELRKKHEGGLDVSSELAEGAQLLREAADRGEPTLAPQLRAAADVLTGAAGQAGACGRGSFGTTLPPTWRPRTSASTRPRRELIAPASSASAREPAPGTSSFLVPTARIRSRGSTLSEAARRLPAVAAMGFDVVYLPPIHPIGTTYRKGRNNALVAASDDPGSPWAIGGPAGGHTAIDPGLGTFEDFATFRAAAEREGLEVALDIAYQCSPDHPWVREHPEWFRHRPDGTIKYAENPPKKYQDIYPHQFRDRRLARAVGRAPRRRRVLVRARRPHLPRGQSAHQGVRLLGVDDRRRSGAISRHDLSVRGVHAAEDHAVSRQDRLHAVVHLLHLAKHPRRARGVFHRARPRPPVSEYLRPNLFANTPDILSEYLQRGGRPAFQMRLVLAATLGASYGIYSGFELVENVPVRHGSEEYLDSEKYQLKPRDWEAPQTIAPLIALVNRIRRDHAALQTTEGLRFAGSDNQDIVAYLKTAGGRSSPVLVVVNLDPVNLQHGFVSFDPSRYSLDPAGYLVRDLLTGIAYTWRGDRNYVRLDPGTQAPAHIFRSREALDMIRPGSATDPLWYKDAVIYQLHVRAFYDSNGDGIGDFRGLTREARLHQEPRRLVHLAAAVLSVASAR